MKQYWEKIASYLLYLLIFLLPWQTRWIWQEGLLNGGTWEYGTFSIYAIDILLVIILVVSFLAPKQSISSTKRWWVLLFSFFSIGFVSIIWSSNNQLSLYSALKLLEGMAMIWLVLRIKFQWRALGIAFIASGVVQATLAIVQFFSQRIVANKWLGLAAHDPAILGEFVVETDGGRFLRAFGSFPHPNMLAGFLVICLIVLVGFLFTMYRDEKPRVLSIVLTVSSFVVIYYGLILTFSRSAWLIYALLILFMITLSISQRDHYRLRILGSMVFWIILVTGFSIILFPEIIQTRTFSSGRLEAQSAATRTEYFIQSGEIISDNWYQGVGIGSYTQALYDRNTTRESWSYQPVHNIYALITAEIGIFGGFLFLVVIFEFFRRVFYNGWSMLRSNTWFLTFAVAFTALLLIGIFEHYLWSLSFGVLFFWLILGLWIRSNHEISVDN